MLTTRQTILVPTFPISPLTCLLKLQPQIHQFSYHRDEGSIGINHGLELRLVCTNTTPSSSGLHDRL